VYCVKGGAMMPDARLHEATRLRRVLFARSTRRRCRTETPRAG